MQWGGSSVTFYNEISTFFYRLKDRPTSRALERENDATFISAHIFKQGHLRHEILQKLRKSKLKRNKHNSKTHKVDMVEATITFIKDLQCEYNFKLTKKLIGERLKEAKKSAPIDYTNFEASLLKIYGKERYVTFLFKRILNTCN